MVIGISFAMQFSEFSSLILVKLENKEKTTTKKMEWNETQKNILEKKTVAHEDGSDHCNNEVNGLVSQ